MNDTPQPEKLEWSPTLLEGKRVTLQEAEAAVSELGEGWRMPTIDELSSIVDRSRFDPAVDVARFPDTKSTWYWSSTPCAWDKSARWVVNFYYGLVNGYYAYNPACVRACRASQ